MEETFAAVWSARAPAVYVPESGSPLRGPHFVREFADKLFAYEVLADPQTRRMHGRGKPRRAAAAQVGLCGVFCIEDGNDGPLGADAGKSRRMSSAHRSTKAMGSGSDIRA